MRTHGLTCGGVLPRVYRIWSGMKARCLCPTNTRFKWYGGRGITVCERWRENVENFIADMGEPPLGMSIDRIDSDGNYEPSNCRWATQLEQVQNRSNNRKYQGKTIAEWSRQLGVNQSSMAERVDRHGWEQAVARPVKSFVQHGTHGGKTAHEWAAALGINVASLYRRINLFGWDAAVTRPIRLRRRAA